MKERKKYRQAEKIDLNNSLYYTYNIEWPAKIPAY